MKTIITLVFLTTLIGCSNEINLEEKNLFGKLNSQFGVDSDTIRFYLSDYIPFDSIYIYHPYTPPSRIKYYHEIGNQLDTKLDDNNCLLVFKEENNYYFSIVPRKFDFARLSGDYHKRDFKRLIGMKMDNELFTLVFEN